MAATKKQQKWASFMWGKHDHESDEFELFAEVKNCHKRDWVIYYKKPRENSKWHDFKIALVGCKRKGRANYAFGWNGERLTYGYDLDSIKENHPLLLEKLLEEIRKRGY